MNKQILLYILILLFFSACEKVIDVDLNEASPALVIEGNLSFVDRCIKVKISKTGSYFNNDIPESVSGASVFLENASGKRFEIIETEKGFYEEHHLNLRTDSEYKLLVEYKNITHTAVSTIYPVVKIDSLNYRYYTGERFYDDGYQINLYFSDPPEQKNYYRIKVYKNGQLENDINDLIVFDDSEIDGKTIQVRLRRQIFTQGDTARIEFLSIDEGAWRYFTTFSEVVNANPGSPSPANPVSNFDNNALGYFSAWSYDYKKIIIKK